MIDETWLLKKENAKLRMALAQAQANLCQMEFNAAQAADKALGEAPPEAHAKAVQAVTK